MKILDNKLDGRIVFWKTVDSDKLRVEDAIKDVIAYPLEDGPNAILRRALCAVYKQPTVLVRPLARDGFAVIEEVRMERGNEYRELLTAYYDEDASRIMLTDETRRTLIEEAFAKEQGIVPAHRVATALVRVVEAFRGVSLRPMGGVYYIPPHAVEQFEKIAQKIEAAGIGHGACESCVYSMRTPTDEQTARAVIDAAIAEATIEADRIEQQVASGDLGKRALASREQRSADILAKLESFEALFGSNIEAIKHRIEKVKGAAATAAIMNVGATNTESFL